MPKFFEAEIPGDAIVYDVDLNRHTTIDKIPAASYFGCFIPEKELSRITNVKEICSPYEGVSYKEFREEDDF